MAFGLAGLLPAHAAEPVPWGEIPNLWKKPVTPEDTTAPPDTAAREALTKPRPKSGLARLGPLEFFPRATVSALFDDNIEIQKTNQQSDVIWTLSPAVMMVGGNPGVELPRGITFEGLRMLPRQPYIGLDAEPAKMLLLDYAPSYQLFTDHDKYNALNHSALFTGIYSLSRLTLGADVDFRKTSDTVGDVGRRITSQELSARLTTKYDLSDRTCVQVNGEYRDMSYDDARLTGSRQWVNQNWINRQLSGKINAGLGLTLGYWDVDRFPSQTFEQLLLRGIYRFAEKMDVTLAVGGEYRQSGGGGSATLDPVVMLAGSYRPVDATSFTLEAHRQQHTSPTYGNQNYTLTGFSGGVRQRLGEKWHVSLNGGYDMVDYRATVSGVTASRSDDYFSVRVGVDYQFAERWTSGAYHVYRRNSSNTGYGYDNNQFGVQVSWRF
ncbi:MAG: outer membrane beta-barrel protein [Verrucomicrobia bacterium]|nr:outer membrane beta-barrel protein [Verrucomicrobiota bacterium]